MKKGFIVLLAVVLLTIVSITSHYISSFLSDIQSRQQIVNVGEVKVIARAFHENSSNVLTELDYVDIGNGQKKLGIYEINLVDRNQPNFIENVRIFVDVYSKQESYFRIKIHEQLTFTRISIDTTKPHIPEIKTEISLLMEKPTDFNYIFNSNNTLDSERLNWYDNREIDGYIYYKLPIERIDSSTPARVGLIKSYYPSVSYISQPRGYSLQLAITVEAVQIHGGPVQNWGIENPPWGGNWK